METGPARSVRCFPATQTFMNILDKLFGKAEEINGRERCPTYLYRWTLIKRSNYSVYLHHFVADDWSLDLHDHPKRFISIGLWGSYVEETPYMPASGPARSFSRHRNVLYRAPWIRSFPPEHIHRLKVNSSCWTLVIVGKSRREWGFWHQGKFIPWRDYVDGEIADKRKACP